MKGTTIAAAVLAATSCASALMADCSDIPGFVALPATVSAEERQRVEKAVGRPVHEVACIHLAKGMQFSLDRSQVAAGFTGYLALTDEAVVFVGSASTIIPFFRRRDVEVLASFDDITHVLVPGTQSGPNTFVELGVDKGGSMLSIARSRNGDAFIEALRMRVIAACGTGVIVTAVGVTCPDAQ